MGNKTHIRVVRDTDKMSVTFKQIDKDTEKEVDELVILWDDVHEDTIQFIELYGLTKILQDRCSQVDAADKFEAYKELFEDTLAIGLTEKERASKGKRLSAIESEALAKYFTEKAGKPVSQAAVQAQWKTLDEDKKEAVLKAEKVVALIEEVKAEASQAEELDFDFADE